MKIILCFFFLCSVLFTAAQQKALIQDKEKLFSAEEIIRLDSLLQQYHQRSDKIVLIATDSADVNDPTYENELFHQYFPDSNSQAMVIMLLMSRKSQSIKLTVSKALVPYISQQLLLEMIGMGVPSFKEKRREEGATIICKKSMEFLDGLPKKN